MRRKDKKIKDKKEIESIIKKALFCRIAVVNNDIPYIIPVNFGYKDNFLYFHSAPVSKKIDILKINNNICFEIDLDVKLKKESKVPCSWTMKYYSVIGFGNAFFIENIEEKKEALNIIVNHYLPGNSFDYSEELFNKVVIIKVKISQLTGKKSGY
ncbi:MAG: pyridoxamine 5'-phosphate oxidase family protein [Promethearchaeota archaeon]